ncbi:prepilin-type N-terminal cleavage/methylation domain-containing protein [Anaerosphaera multitolerans]|uniref:Prepilin-type N-terminal cleavage/methylation domain-containing protein n=1 Tax=Anaerosphaera multitolerans TaxID=2487351 RepID=A0A437S7Q5_9FIRM|nr:prepilin-type N-terminal cleavage/methylation domain-containing protein [Anaerosphaera multitolerans]RVU54964.1 prepilin-type N-terminal cleavage/methylation domain-containing protein [Anaerosphaera multitolerans]
MKKAFTLIEIIIVISILLILLSIGVFSSAMVEDFKIREDVKLIHRDLKNARNLAISKKDNSKVKFNNENSYTIICGDISENREYSEKIKIKFKRKDGNIETTRTVEFTKRGVSAYGSSGTIELSTPKKIYEITIEPVTGKVNLKDEKGIYSY